MGALEALFVILKPSNAVFLVLVAGLALSLWRRWLGTGLIALGLVAAGAVMYLPVGRAMMEPLETRFERFQAPKLDGIILLGGFLGTKYPDPLDTLLGDAGERLLATAVLAREHPEARIIITDISEAKPAAEVLSALGIARERIVTEERATSTWENARFTKALVDPQPGETYALVTSAYHMPRSIGAFRGAGWTDLVAIPVDRRTIAGGLWQRLPLNPSVGLTTTDTATREWSALLGYHLAGRTAEWLPGPTGETTH